MLESTFITSPCGYGFSFWFVFLALASPKPFFWGVRDVTALLCKVSVYRASCSVAPVYSGSCENLIEGFNS
jgi:hypothetical protein